MCSLFHVRSMKMRMKLACAATTCPTAWSSRSSRPSADPLSVSSNELRYFSIPAWPIFLADSSVFHLFVCWCLVPVWFFRAARICSTNFDFELGVAEACFLPCHVASETSLQGQQQRAAPCAIAISTKNSNGVAVSWSPSERELLSSPQNLHT